MKTTVKKVSLLLLAALIMLLIVSFVAINLHSSVAFAAGEEDVAAVGSVDGNAENSIEIVAEQTKQTKGWAAAAVIGAGAVVGAIMMGLSIMKAIDGIARQPEAEGKIRTTLMLGLVFIETAIIYALIVAILVVFVL